MKGEAAQIRIIASQLTMSMRNANHAIASVLNSQFLSNPNPKECSS